MDFYQVYCLRLDYNSFQKNNKEELKLNALIITEEKENEWDGLVYCLNDLLINSRTIDKFTWSPFKNENFGGYNKLYFRTQKQTSYF